MSARYRRTLAGFLWVILNPIIMYTAQSLVFMHVLRIGIPDYGLFLLGGLLPWSFIVASLDMGIPALPNSKDLLVAFKMDPYVLTISTLLDNAINFLAAFIIVMLPLALFSRLEVTGLIFLPFAAIPLFIGTAGLVWLLSVVNIFYRDTRFVTHFVTNVLFFVTPIFYPRDFMPEPYRWIIDFNPVFALIEPVRLCIHQFSLQQFGMALAKSVLLAAGSVTVSLLYWRRRKNEFYYYL